VREALEKQRNLYKYIHDETLRLANHGFTMVEIAEMVELPESLATYWPNRGLYGSLSHNVKAVYQRYLGWFDGNPASLHQLPPRELGRRWAAQLGGVGVLVAAAQTAFDQGDYRWATELAKHALAAEPEHAQAREVQARIFEQLGYQAECGPWRNFYLSGAHELRHGVRPTGRGRARELSELQAAMSVEMALDFLGIRLNGPRAAGVRLSFAVVGTEATPERHLVSVEDGVLVHQRRSETAVPTELVCDSLTLIELADGRGLDDLLASGRAQIQGDPDVLKRFFELLDTFEPSFPIATPVSVATAEGATKGSNPIRQPNDSPASV